MPLSKDAFSICQFPVGVTASRQIMADVQMSVRCQISRSDAVCESPSIRLVLRNFGQFQLQRTVTQSEPNTVSTAMGQVLPEFIHSLWICYWKVSLCSSQIYWDQCFFTQYCVQYKRDYLRRRFIRLHPHTAMSCFISFLLLFTA